MGRHMHSPVDSTGGGACVCRGTASSSVAWGVAHRPWSPERMHCELHSCGRLATLGSVILFSDMFLDVKNKQEAIIKDQRGMLWACP